MISHFPSIAGLSLLVFSLTAEAHGDAEKMKGLLLNSPFRPASLDISVSNAVVGPLEFRARLEENGRIFFSIYETATRRSIWVELDGSVNGFLVRGYDAEKESVTVDYEGRSLTLAIKRASPDARVSLGLAPEIILPATPPGR